MYRPPPWRTALVVSSETTSARVSAAGAQPAQHFGEGAGDLTRPGDTGGAVTLDHDRRPGACVRAVSVSVMRYHPALDRLCRQAQPVPAGRPFNPE